MECTRCLYSTDFIPEMWFDANGVCEYCHQHDEWDKQFPVELNGLVELTKIANKIKKSSKGKKYDCVVGLSGGCDSSITLFIAKKLMRLNPLAVNYDNGFDTKTARENIERVCKGLEVDLKVIKPDENEIIEVWKAFLRASVPDVEAPTDIALTTALYQAAADAGVKYILNGHSFRTEGWVPKGKSYMDGKYIKNVFNKFGFGKLKTFPNLTLSKWLYWMLIKRIRRIRPLYYFSYDKELIKKKLNEYFGWEWYGAHHAENKFTAWFGNYFRPVKCDFDSRIISRSALIRSGYISREEGKKAIESAFPFEKAYQSFIEDKFGWSRSLMNFYINQPLRDVAEFKTYKNTFHRLKPLFFVLYKLNMIPKTFYEKYVK